MTGRGIAIARGTTGMLCLLVSALSACVGGSVSEGAPRRSGDPSVGGKADDGSDVTEGPSVDGGPDAPPVDPCPPTPAPSAHDVVVDVPLAGPYGTRSFAVPALANWVSAGVYLKAGETATVRATGGQWSYDGAPPHGAAGATGRGSERGCPRGALAARVGLRYADTAITCVSSGTATITAQTAGPLFVGMIVSTDLGETYHSRDGSTGALTVEVTSTAGTFPTITRDELGCVDVNQVASGHLELAGRHVSVVVPLAAVQRDAWIVAPSLDTLDALYDAQEELRGAVPYGGQRIRFLRDDAIDGIGYMLAGNPIRMVRELEDGAPEHRILRASDPVTDVWGFAHELGHTFTFVGGTWTYMRLNLESWPNVFTLWSLEQTGRLAHQPNATTYCDGQAGYLAGGPYSTFKDDPFVQLCFLMEFKKAHGWDVWKRFYMGLNGTTNADIPNDGTDASVWRFARDRLSAAAGQDVTPTFNAWRVPL